MKKFKGKITKKAIVLLVSFLMVFMSITISAQTDSDNDGISDSLELNGYMLDDYNQIVSWDDNENSNYHKSDPNTPYTTGDPYSDLSKVRNSILYSNIDEASRTNPEVAATPNLTVELKGIGLTPKETTGSSEGGGTENGQSTGSSGSNSDTHTFTTELSFGVEHKFGPTGGTTASFEASFAHSYAMEKTTAWSMEESTSTMKNWMNTVELDTSEAAELSLDLKYTNIGQTPLSNILPRFTILVGDDDERVVTYTPDDTQKISYLAPGESVTVTVNRITNVDTLTLSLSQLNKLLDNQKLKIEMTEIQAEIPGNNRSEDIYEYYIDDIKGKTADIEFRYKDGTSKVYQVVAQHSGYNPHMNLYRALKLLKNADKINGNVYIDSTNLTDWDLMYNDDLRQRIQSLDNTGKNFYDVELNHNDHVILYEPVDDVTPVIHWTGYSGDYTQIYANISRGSDKITSVEAHVRINGVENNIELQYESSIDCYKNTNPLSTPIDPTYMGELIVTTQSGKRITKIIEAKKEGLKYVPLSSPISLVDQNETKNLLTGNTNVSLSDYPSAKALAVQIVSNRWSSQDASVTVGNTTAQLGVGDIKYSSFKLKLTDNQGKVYTIEGSGNLYELDNVNNRGIPHDKIVKVELLGNKGYILQLYEHSSFMGDSWSIYNIDLPIDLKRSLSSDNIDGTRSVDLSSHKAENKLSSLRVAYVGTDYNHARWHLWLKNFGTGRAYIAGNSSYAADLNQVGIRNDDLEHVEFITYPGSNFSAYEDGHQGGERWYFRDSGTVYHGHGVSSFKVFYYGGSNDQEILHQGAKTSPIVSKTLVVPVSNNTLPISWNIKNGIRNMNQEQTDAWLDVKILGYFTEKESEGYKYKALTKDLTTITGLNNRETSVSTNVQGAKGYIVNVINNKISSDNVSVTLNGVKTHLGASDAFLIVKDVVNTYQQSDWSDTTKSKTTINNNFISPTRSNILFIPADSINPSIIEVSTDISDYNGSSSSNPNIKIQMLGYFSDDADLVLTLKEYDLHVNEHTFVSSGQFPKAYLANSTINTYLNPDRNMSIINDSAQEGSDVISYVGGTNLGRFSYSDYSSFYNSRQDMSAILYSENPSGEIPNRLKSATDGIYNENHNFYLIGYFH